MPGNNNKVLHAANRAKEDEFYTQLPDIEDELRHYKEHFKGQTVYCNCDDPLESKFFIYFVKHFRELGLKKLITTCFDGSPIAGSQLLLDFEETRKSPKRVAYKIEVDDVEEFSSTDGEITFWDVADALRSGTGKAKLEKLRGNGDFQSKECVRLLDESDIVVTNPPFSLFREYLSQLIEYGKKFLIIGPQNAITYREIFTLIKENKMWLGCKSGDMSFTVPQEYEERATRFWIDKNGQKWRSMGNICWFTNLDHEKRHEQLDLVEKYSRKKFPKYDNYNAIEVNKVMDIPRDYDGAMGVPITFLDKYNPDQFEIIKFRKGNDDRDLRINGRCPYFRILIRRKQS